eukprot:397747-Rhodomonas_salina.1
MRHLTVCYFAVNVSAIFVSAPMHTAMLASAAAERSTNAPIIATSVGSVCTGSPCLLHNLSSTEFFLAESHCMQSRIALALSSLVRLPRL